MEKVEVSAVIKYLCKKGMSPKEIPEDFMETLRKESPSFNTVKKWVAEFRRGRESTEDDEQSGHPKEATTVENIKIVQSLVMCTRRRTLWDKATEVGISFGAVQSILTDILECPRFQLDGSPECWPKVRREAGSIFLGISCLTMKMTLRNSWTELWPRMRLGSINLTWNLKSKACSRSTLAQPLIRNLSEFLQQWRWWPLSFGIMRE